MFQIFITNDCKAPRFTGPETFGEFKTRAAAERAAKAWNAHIAPFNRVMKQNVVYAVVDPNEEAEVIPAEELARMKATWPAAIERLLAEGVGS
jgi:hypothetical protein